MIAPFARIEKPLVPPYRPEDGLAADDGRDRGSNGFPEVGDVPAGRHGASGSHGTNRPPQRPPDPGLATTGDLSRLLTLLADKTRLKILRILAGGERPVVALTAELRLPQPTVSHHLAWLRMMDLVSPRRQGKHVFYTLGAGVRCDDDGTMTLRAADATVTIRTRDAK